jgi:NAD(P)H-hydrate repair Nnr-like enzyme with NAD(P)H-hydrate epimerase domain/8-oxo-dGTP pyrophosphatase MutT (NUDIX family)
VSESDIIARLTESLAALPTDRVETPPADRLGAVLVLIEPGPGGEATLVYTRRRDDLRSHPGQISFPGGRVDPGESVEEAALREANEEVALDPAGAKVLGRLPAFFIPPSRFWLQPVVAHWARPHDLVASEAEVAAVLHVPLSRLLDQQHWRVVGLSSAGWSWAWDLGEDHLLWGATAMVTAVLLGLIDADWNHGAEPKDFLEREVRPWEDERRVVDRRQPPRLSDVEQRHIDDFLADPDEQPVLTAERIAAAGARVAEAAVKLAGDRPGPIAVLAGGGGTGAVGRAAAAVLADAGREAVVVALDGFSGSLPADTSVLVDALVGSGLDGPLRGRAQAAVHALRLRANPVVSVDLPTGLHATDGMIGDAVSADVTIAIGGAAPGLLLPGLAPFVGDLYVAAFAPAVPPLVRVIGSRVAPTWRE